MISIVCLKIITRCKKELNSHTYSKPLNQVDKVQNCHEEMFAECINFSKHFERKQLIFQLIIIKFKPMTSSHKFLKL